METAYWLFCQCWTNKGLNLSNVDKNMHQQAWNYWITCGCSHMWPRNKQSKFPAQSWRSHCWKTIHKMQQQKRVCILWSTTFAQECQRQFEERWPSVWWWKGLLEIHCDFFQIWQVTANLNSTKAERETCWVSSIPSNVCKSCCTGFKSFRCCWNVNFGHSAIPTWTSCNNSHICRSFWCSVQHIQQQVTQK